MTCAILLISHWSKLGHRATHIRKELWVDLEISPENYRDVKGTFHARKDMIKDRNGKDLTEVKNNR